MTLCEKGGQPVRTMLREHHFFHRLHKEQSSDFFHLRDNCANTNYLRVILCQIITRLSQISAENLLSGVLDDIISFISPITKCKFFAINLNFYSHLVYCYFSYFKGDMGGQSHRVSSYLP